MRLRRVVALGTLIAIALTVANAEAKTKAKKHKPVPLTVAGLAAKLTIGYAYVDPKLARRAPLQTLQPIATAHAGYRVAILGTLPTGTVSAQTAAFAALARLSKATPPISFVAIIHVTATGLDVGGAARTTPNPLVISDAARAAAKNATLPGAMKAFVDAIARYRPPAPTPKESGGVGLVTWIVGGVAILLAGLASMRLRKVSRERRSRARVGSIGTARTFHLARLDGLSARHAAKVGVVGEQNESPALHAHHETAGAKLVAIRRQMAGLFSPRELRTCALELDAAEWHVQCTEAILADATVPPEPRGDRPGLCFFTHEHGLGTVEVEVKRPDASLVTIWVCPENAVALARGEELLVSTVHVGGRRVPWPAAPTYYGAPGWGSDELPGLEHGGREIWGRRAPARELPPEVPPESVPGTRASDVLPPGVWTPLPPGVSAPPVPLDAQLPIVGTTQDFPLFEELENEITAEHAALTPDETRAYDPLADDDHVPPWERASS